MDGVGIDASTVQGPDDERCVPDFRKRYGDARHLPAGDESVAAGILNFPARRRLRGGEEVLARSACGPLLPFDYLHLRCAPHERQGEKHEEGVYDRDAIRGFHFAGPGVVSRPACR